MGFGAILVNLPMSGVLNQMKKLGPLQPLLDDPSITEIMINGPDCVFIEQNGRVTRSPQHFESKKQLEENSCM